MNALRFSQGWFAGAILYFAKDLLARQRPSPKFPSIQERYTFPIFVKLPASKTV